ncbi:flagellar biosynthetic protein FliO [Paraliobacillus sp. JSM ZJ581]|uniref:flagellar biosynthetic protein FliO n=1 Tax=Paraliobacillus sp. JSM ZJ581 TaxID=3342118 RepID=UPI0035A89A80
MNKRYVMICFLLLISFFALPNTINASQDNDNNNVYEWLNDDANKQQDSEEKNNSKQMNKEQDSNDLTISEDQSTNFFTIVVRIVFSLLLIVGLIYGMLKLINKKNKFARQSNILKNLGGIPLGTNKSVQVIQIGERLFVVGVGENIELLTEIQDQDLKDKLFAEKNPDSENSSHITKILGSTFSNLSIKKEKNEEKISDSFSHLFKSELNNLKQTRKKVTNRYKHKEEDKYE